MLCNLISEVDWCGDVSYSIFLDFNLYCEVPLIFFIKVCYFPSQLFLSLSSTLSALRCQLSFFDLGSPQDSPGHD